MGVKVAGQVYVLSSQELNPNCVSKMLSDQFVSSCISVDHKSVQIGITKIHLFNGSAPISKNLEVFQSNVFAPG